MLAVSGSQSVRLQVLERLLQGLDEIYKKADSDSGRSIRFQYRVHYLILSSSRETQGLDLRGSFTCLPPPS